MCDTAKIPNILLKYFHHSTCLHSWKPCYCLQRWQGFAFSQMHTPSLTGCVVEHK